MLRILDDKAQSERKVLGSNSSMLALSGENTKQWANVHSVMPIYLNVYFRRKLSMMYVSLVTYT